MENNPSSPSAIPERRSSAGFLLNRTSPKAAASSVQDSWISYGADGPNVANGIATSSSSPTSKRHSKQRKTRQDPDRPPSMRAKLIFQESNTWSAEKDKLLMGPFDYLHGHPGKDIRSQLIAAFNMWLDVPEESLAIITGVVGMLHTASLLVDDVEDNSLLRRGVPVAHSIFGTAQTINSANYVYFRALEDLQKLRSPEAIQVYATELLNLHRGQGMDLYWRDTLTCPTEDDYLEMVDNKTGGLFRLAIKLMQAESTSSKNCIPLANAIGLLFQILDDYKNLSSVVYTQNKGFAEDLTEGKFSFPIIHSIRSDPTNLVLINILKQKTQDEDVKRYAMKYMESTGSFAYTRGVLRELTAKSLAIIEQLESGDEQGRQAGAAVRKILDKLNVDEP